MTLRLKAKLGLWMKFLPNFFYAVGAKRNIKVIKHSFEHIQEATKNIIEAQKELNMEKMLNALDSYIDGLNQTEEAIATVDEDVFVLEFRDMELLNKFKDHFEKLMSNKKVSEGFKEKMKPKIQKYNATMSEIVSKLNLVKDEYRRETFGRRLVRDFMLAELFAIYFQMKMRVKELRRKSSTLKYKEKELLHEFDEILRKPDIKKLNKIYTDFDSFIDSIKVVVSDAVFIERILVLLRRRLLSLDEKEKKIIADLIANKFPKEKLEKHIKEISEFEKQVIADIDEEYAQARQLAYMGKTASQI